MMKLSPAPIAALAISTHAAPSPPCLTQDQATSIIQHFVAIQEHQNTDWGSPNATAQRLLADDYQEISDSILSLEQQPLGTITFTGKQDWINGILSALPQSEIETIDILVAGCTKVLWQWNFHAVGSKRYEVKGFNLFTISPTLQICRTELEFNSIAWGLDTGALPCGNGTGSRRV